MPRPRAGIINVALITMALLSIASSGLAVPAVPAVLRVPRRAVVAEGSIPHKLAVFFLPHSGININFIPLNENIMRVWISDPTRVVLDSDMPLCDRMTPTDPNAANACSIPATVIRIRPLGKRIPLDYNAPDPTRLNNLIFVSVVTIAPNNRRALYQFALRLTPSIQVPHTIEIVPDSFLPILPPITTPTQ